MICRKETNLMPCTLYETDKDIGEIILSFFLKKSSTIYHNLLLQIVQMNSLSSFTVP